ncbi:MAG TPA: hypothetical protein VHQ46_07375 [Desulfobacteria bacterium]|nr:hypothetical protein [Desulfobacteria bacterium]
MQTINIAVGEGRTKVALAAALTGRGINILLTGGESPHIGAVVLAVPRPSDTGTGKSSDSWVTPVAGHKDNVVAEMLADRISRATNQVTVVSAGIHIDRAERWELDLIQRNCIDAGERLLKTIVTDD